MRAEVAERAGARLGGVEPPDAGASVAPQSCRYAARKWWISPISPASIISRARRTAGTNR